MTWFLLTIFSAILLGAYDIAKKVSVKQNAVPVVLLISVSIGAFVWTPLIALSYFGGDSSHHGPENTATSIVPAMLQVQPLDRYGHARLFAKSLLVGMSWTFAFFAMKHLPLSIAAPIRSTSPLWTILIATIFLGERPMPMQWLGMVIVLGSFWRFSFLGKSEGIHFRRNRFVGWMVVATLLGSLSSIYDKILLQNYALPPATVQAWFSVYLVPVMLPMAWRWYRIERAENPFEFRRSILWICPLLLLADFAYFTALASPEALVSVVSTIRRCSVIIPFFFGIRALGEANFRKKAICIATMLAGVALLAWK